MTKIQVLVLAVIFLQCVCSQTYDVDLSYGNQATVSDQGQKVVTVPVFLLSEKKRKPRQRTPAFQKVIPQFGLSPSQLNANYAKVLPFPANFQKPPVPHLQPPLPINQPLSSFPPTRNVQPPFPGSSNNFDGGFRTHSPPQLPQQHQPKIQNNFNKPPTSETYFSRPPSPVSTYQTNYVKVNSNANPPSYHKPVPPPTSFNKQPPSHHNQRQKIRAPVQSVSLSAPQPRKPFSQPQNSYRKPSYSQPPQPVDFDKPSSTVYVKAPPSFSINVPSQRPSYSSQNSGTSYDNPSSGTIYSLPSSSSTYNIQPSSSSFISPPASAYNNPSTSYSSSSKPSSSSYSNYDSSVNFSPTSYSQPASYEQTSYGSEIAQNPSYTSDGSSAYAVQQSTFTLPSSKVVQFSRPSSEATLYEAQDDVKASESSEQSETEEDDDMSVSYKVVYIPLEVLKTILSNSGLK